MAHSFGTGPGFLLGFLPRVLTHVKGEGHRFLVKFLAQVIGLGSRFWLLTLFQWIWLAQAFSQVTDVGCWSMSLTQGSLSSFMAQVFVLCY